MSFDGETLASLTVDNNLIEASYIRDQIVDIAQKYVNQEIIMAMEVTSVYSWHSAMFFHKDRSLKRVRTKVLTINPKLIKKFKVHNVDLDKTNHIDAWIIADLLRFRCLRQPVVMQDQFIALLDLEILPQDFFI